VGGGKKELFLRRGECYLSWTKKLVPVLRGTPRKVIAWQWENGATESPTIKAGVKLSPPKGKRGGGR